MRKYARRCLPPAFFLVACMNLYMVGVHVGGYERFMMYQKSTIGDFIYRHADKADDIQDGLPSELGIGGVTVQLYVDSNNNRIFDVGVDQPYGPNPVEITNASGAYIFEGLPADNYIVVIPNDGPNSDVLDVSYVYIGTNPNGTLDDPALAQHAVNLPSGYQYDDADFGYGLKGCTQSYQLSLEGFPNMSIRCKSLFIKLRDANPESLKKTLLVNLQDECPDLYKVYNCTFTRPHPSEYHQCSWTGGPYLMEKATPVEQAPFTELLSMFNRQNITYRVAKGDALGALRHGSNIPWDQDMDIVIPVWLNFPSDQLCDDALTSLAPTISVDVKLCGLLASEWFDKFKTWFYPIIEGDEFVNYNLTVNTELKNQGYKWRLTDFGDARPARTVDLLISLFDQAIVMDGPLCWAEFNDIKVLALENMESYITRYYPNWETVDTGFRGGALMKKFVDLGE